MKSQVIIVECREYEQEAVTGAVSKAVDLAGGWHKFVSPDENIILKPNLLTKCPPEKACTTHPQVFYGAGKLLQEAGFANLKYGDSPGPNRATVEQTAEGCGIKAVADALAIPMADFEGGSKVPFPEGVRAKEFVLCNAVQEEAALINLCKMKTHQLERITGAVKNTFGCVYGFNKGAAHAIYPNAESFAQMLADLNKLVKPRLHIMDGIVAMEGNGPQSGDPKSMNMILVSDDPVALDTVYCSLIHLDPQLVATNVYGQRYGVGTCDPDQIEVVTEGGTISVAEAVSRWGDPSFKVKRDPEYVGAINSVRFLQPILKRKPYVIKEKCISCGICINACPLEEKAIFFKDRIPVYNHRACINCYCCQEMCPQQAIDVKETFLSRIARHKF